MLGAERATDVRSDHPHPLRVHAQEPGEDPSNHVGHLAGEMHREVKIGAGRIDGDGAPLHGHHRHPLVLEATTHDDVGPRERVLAATAQPDDDVAADGLELQRRIRRQCILHVDDGPERVVVDLHQLGGIHGQGPRLGDHDDDRIADEVDGSLGERRPDRRRMQHHQGRSVGKIEVICAIDAHDSRASPALP